MPGGSQHPRNFGRCSGGIVQHALGTGHFAHDQHLAVKVLDLVMQAETHRALGGTRCA